LSDNDDDDLARLLSFGDFCLDAGLARCLRSEVCFCCTDSTFRCLLDGDGDTLSSEVRRLREDTGDRCLAGRRPNDESRADLCGGLLLE